MNNLLVEISFRKYKICVSRIGTGIKFSIKQMVNLKLEGQTFKQTKFVF